jgi:hypothetical protein
MTFAHSTQTLWIIGVYRPIGADRRGWGRAGQLRQLASAATAARITLASASDGWRRTHEAGSLLRDKTHVRLQARVFVWF